VEVVTSVGVGPVEDAVPPVAVFAGTLRGFEPLA